MRSVETAGARHPVKNSFRWATAALTRSSDFRPFARYSSSRRLTRSSTRVWSASGTYVPWRIWAFQCSSCWLATAREVVRADRLSGRPPTQSFIIHVRHTLSWPVFLSRYRSRKREPEPRSLMDDLVMALPRSEGRDPGSSRQGRAAAHGQPPDVARGYC